MFAGGEEQQKWLEEEGFLLPDGYRFGDNEYERRTKECEYHQINGLEKK